MRSGEADEPGSSDYNKRLWRRERNETTIHQTQPQKESAGSNEWDVPAGLLHNVSQPHHLCFHQFENHLVVSDDRDIVSVWDWEKHIRLARFSNGNAVNARITDIKFINEDDQGLLMVGSADGICKIYRNYESSSEVELVTAWRALTELTPSNINSGLVSEWQQGQGRLLVGGDFKTIKVWSAAKELCTEEIPARSGSCVTSITADQVAGDIFVVGFGDGAVRVYDRRLPSREAMVKVWKEHRAWVVNVHMQRGGLRELVSGSRHGDIKLWDIRRDTPHLAFQATPGTLRSLSVHEHAPILAVGSDHGQVRLFNTDTTKFLAGFTPHQAVETGGFTASGNASASNFLHLANNSNFTGGSTKNPITATAFHPHRMMIAGAGLGEGDVGIFKCRIGKVDRAAEFGWEGENGHPGAVGGGVVASWTG
jgi:regulator-associated protein of mTOR